MRLLCTPQFGFQLLEKGDAIEELLERRKREAVEAVLKAVMLVVVFVCWRRRQC
jgi:hypothetical protein